MTMEGVISNSQFSEFRELLRKTVSGLVCVEFNKQQFLPEEFPSQVDISRDSGENLMRRVQPTGGRRLRGLFIMLLKVSVPTTLWREIFREKFFRFHFWLCTIIYIVNFTYNFHCTVDTYTFAVKFGSQLINLQDACWCTKTLRYSVATRCISRRFVFYLNLLYFRKIERARA